MRGSRQSLLNRSLRLLRSSSASAQQESEWRARARLKPSGSRVKAFQRAANPRIARPIRSAAAGWDLRAAAKALAAMMALARARTGLEGRLASTQADERLPARARAAVQGMEP